MENKLRKLRKSKCVSQTQLAYASGVSRVTISQIENRPMKMLSLDTCYRLATALGCDVEHIWPNPYKAVAIKAPLIYRALPVCD